MTNATSQRMISVMVSVEPRMLHDLLQLVLARTGIFQVVYLPENAGSTRRGDKKMGELDKGQTPLDWLVVSLTDGADLPPSVWHRLETARPSALLALGDEGDYAEIWVKGSQQWMRKFTIKAISLTVLLAILRYKRERPFPMITPCSAYGLA